jgi:hypothetical protein
MEIFAIILFFSLTIILMLLPLFRTEEPKYKHEDDPELDALIQELLTKRIEKKRHLTIIRKENDGQTDSKTNN